MPLYDVMAIVKGAMPQQQVAMILKKAANAVLDNGGVLTDVRSFGVNRLAYTIRKYGEKFDEGHYVQLSFFSSPAALPVLEHNFRTDERLLRHIVIKKKAMPNLPKPKYLKMIQEDILKSKQ